MTTNCLIGLVAETPIHVGVGQAGDALDLPVARETTTHFPHVPGSGVKGALRVWAGGTTLDVNALFGPPTLDDGSDRAAGSLLCGEARLALLPVRCTSASFKLATCPRIVTRLTQDRARGGLPAIAVATITVDAGTYLGAPLAGNAPLGLEEREFTHAGNADAVIDLFLPLLGAASDKIALAAKIVILNDDDFVWFAQFALPVAMRNSLNEHKIVKDGGLWSEETLATDTVMWMLLGEREAGKVDLVTPFIGTKPYVQMGGNETIGQGWFKMNLAEGAS